MAYTAYLLAALFVSFEFEIVTAQSSLQHSVLWDRFWINQNLNNNTLDVQLGDVIQFNCSVNNLESLVDRFENIIMLTEEDQSSNCNVGTSTNPQRFIGCCQAAGYEFIIQITDSLSLANRPTFQPGETYYFTSFSNGTIDSCNGDIIQGGACGLDPPLKLAINVLVEVPRPPTNVRARVLTPHAVEVTWDQSSSSDVAVYLISYTTTVSYTSGGNVTLNGDTTSLTLLEENTLYTIIVRAVSGDGRMSDSSNEVSVKTYSDVPSSPPQNVTVVSIDPAYLMVLWQPPPVIDHNGQLTSYVIQYTRVGSRDIMSVIVNGRFTQYIISGLVAYVDYLVIVAAVTVNGTGPFSSPVVGRSGVDIPTEPQSLETIFVNSNSVTLRWLPPEIPNGIITQYSITFNGTVINNFGNNTLMGTVEGLSPDTLYVLQLRAHTRVGAGPPSSITVTTLAEEDCLVTSVRGRVKYNQRKRTTLRFSSDGDPKVTYRCKLDDRSSAECTSPMVWRNLKKGRHTISLRAFCVDDEGKRSTVVRKNFKFRIRS